MQFCDLIQKGLNAYEAQKQPAKVLVVMQFSFWWFKLLNLRNH